MENQFPPSGTPPLTGEQPLPSQTPGTAEVHTRVNAAGQRLSPPDPSQALPPAGETAGRLDQTKAKAGDLADQAIGQAEELRDRASDAAGRAKAKAGEAYDQAHSALADSGALDVVRDNALPALGLAFGLGFLMAGSGDEGRGNKTVNNAKQQLKGAIMGGLSAAVAQEFRSVAGIGGGGSSGSSLSSLFGGGKQSRKASEGNSSIITDTTSSAMPSSAAR